MAVDLFSLNVKLGATGTGAVLSDLRAVDAAGIKTAASLGGLGGSLGRVESAALNGTKGFKDLSGAYANQERVLAGLTPVTVTSGKAIEEHAEKTKKATKAASEHSETLHGLWGTLKQLAGAYFLFEGVHFVGEALEQAAALHELSQKTGVTADTLSVLQFAGRRANVSIEQLGTAFKGMALSQGNLRDGVAKTAEAYQRLGFNADSFKGLSPEQTFIKLAIAVGNVKDETERAEIAQRVFGRSGSMLIPLFEDLARDGFAKTTEEAKKFGAVITQDMADAADKAQDDWNDIKDMFSGMARSTLPAVTIAVKTLYEMLTLGGSGGGGFWAPFRAEMQHTLDDLKGFWAYINNVAESPEPLVKALWHNLFNPFADVSGGSSTSTADPAATTDAPAGTKHVLTAEEKAAAREREAAAKRAREDYNRDVLGRANMDGSMRAPDKLDYQGVAADHLALKSPLDVSGSLTPGVQNRPGVKLMATLKQDLFNGLQQLQPFATGLQSFFSTLFSGGSIGASFKNFGRSILAGMGSIFSQMAIKAIAAAPLFQAIGAAMSNPFTAGAALLAFGIALKALGASMGGAAHGDSGGSGGGFIDRTTQITLSASGAGGLTAPHREMGPTIRVFGKDDAEGQRMFGEHYKSATRSRNI